MRLPLQIVLAVFVLVSTYTFANSLNSSDANFTVQVNPGSGASIEGLITGPGFNLTIAGGTFVTWFNGFAPGYAPGSIGGGGTPLYWDFELLQVGSQSYASFNDEIFAPPSFLNTGSFTFPTNGQDFTISMPASIGGITLVTICPVNCPTFDLGPFAGTLTLSFYFSGGGYYANSASFTIAPTPTPTPEPGTLGLMATGIVAVAWGRLKQKRDL